MHSQIHKLYRYGMKYNAMSSIVVYLLSSDIYQLSHRSRLIVDIYVQASIMTYNTTLDKKIRYSV